MLAVFLPFSYSALLSVGKETRNLEVESSGDVVRTSFDSPAVIRGLEEDVGAATTIASIPKSGTSGRKTGDISNFCMR